MLDVSLIPSSITAKRHIYIDEANEVIVDLQTDAPLKRAIMPNGGRRMLLSSLKTYGYDAPSQWCGRVQKHGSRTRIAPESSERGW